VWLFARLAELMGFDEECFRDTPEQLIEQALAVGPDGYATVPAMEHITLDALKEQGHIPVSFHREPNTRPFMPFVSGSVPTPSGKIEFYSETLAAQGLDALPKFHPPTESRWGKEAERFPLEFLPRKSDTYMNSTFANLDGHRKIESRTNQKLELHPDDAKARGIIDGDRVRVFNDRGSIHLTALTSQSLPAGVVVGRLDWAKRNTDAMNVNALTSERLTDIGAAATFYSTLVEVVKDPE